MTRDPPERNPSSATTAQRVLPHHSTPVYTVVTAVAELEDCTPDELPPLFDVIDPDALTELVASDGGLTVERITFRYLEYDITVTQQRILVRAAQ
ncbi:HalOD1 output domain-containing protein [Natronorubrum sp. FCH18a]|uniref:HalOD1 output domain-containing protein n=1 Tax=Natronorubrum sp. FCH18a TaxID=3447018 RepID=UPI003F50FCB1